MSPVDLVAAVLQGSGRAIGRPLLTSVAADGDVEALSGRTVGLWVAKTANLVRDDLGLGEGDLVAVRLPCTWQAWVWALGAAWAGADVDLGATEAPVDSPAAVVTTASAAAAHLAGGAEVVALSLLPLSRPGPVPAGAFDFDTEVRAHGDRFTPGAGFGRIQAAGGAGETVAFVDGAGRPRAAGPGDVVLAPRLPIDDGELDALLTSMQGGAALVLAPDGPAGPEWAASVTAQRCTLALPGVQLPPGVLTTA